jgi:serine/threonine protein kinase
MQLSVTFEQSSSSQHAMILQKVLGKGKFTVYHAKGTSSDVNVALKVFPKSSAAEAHFQREKYILNKVQNHKNIINYLPISEHTLPYNMLATEFTPNGDFFDFVTQIGMAGDKKLIRTYFHQLIEGIEFLHSQQVAHLDLKLENLLLDKNFDLKIFDFDQAQNFEDSDLKSGGTTGYRAPELINRNVHNYVALDVYSAGVLLYTFVTGLMPFCESKTNGTKKADRFETFRDDNEKFWKAKVNETGVQFDNDFKELINGMWNFDADSRMTIEEVKRSRWYNKEIYTEGELRRVMNEMLVGLTDI